MSEDNIDDEILAYDDEDLTWLLEAERAKQEKRKAQNKEAVKRYRQNSTQAWNESRRRTAAKRRLFLKNMELQYHELTANGRISRVEGDPKKLDY